MLRIIDKFCTKLISELPSNITCKYQRIATHDDLPGIFNKHHLFILPSKGENYGNVIIESLINGTPVIISDKTPFNNLIIKNIGADIPLDQQNKYIKVINDYVIMENNQYLVISKNAHLFAKNIIASKNIKNMDDIVARFVGGTAASIVAESLTLPFDVTKVRLQVQQDPSVYRGMIPA